MFICRNLGKYVLELEKKIRDASNDDTENFIPSAKFVDDEEK